MTKSAEILAALHALQRHKPSRKLSAGEASEMLADYVEDIQRFKFEHIQEACARYRRSEEKWFPSIRELSDAIQRVADSAKRQQEPASKPWAPISEAEYQSLPLAEKVRHHTIMAAEAGNRAGPQCRDKRAVPASEMPADWHHWKRRQSEHAEEAKRLQAKLRASISADQPRPGRSPFDLVEYVDALA